MKEFKKLTVKKRLPAVIVALAMMFSLTTFGAPGVSADDGLPELTVTGVTRDYSVGAWAHVIHFGSGFAFGCYWHGVNTTLLTLTNAAGENILVKAETANNVIAVNASADGNPQPHAGDVLTLKAGFNGAHTCGAGAYVPTHEIKKEIKFVFDGGTTWTEVGEEVKLAEMTVEEIYWRPISERFTEACTYVQFTPRRAYISGNAVDKQLDTTGIEMTLGGTDILGEVKTADWGISINQKSGAIPADGTLLTFKKGFKIVLKDMTGETDSVHEIKEDTTYEYLSDFGEWVKEGEQLEFERLDVKKVEWEPKPNAADSRTYVQFNPIRGYTNENKWDKPIDTTYIEMTLNDVDVLENALTSDWGIAINKGEAEPANNTVLTFKAGFRIILENMSGESASKNEIKEDITFIYTGGKWVLQMRSSLTAMVTPTVILDSAIGGMAGVSAVRVAFDNNPIIDKTAYWQAINTNYLELTDCRGNNVLEKAEIFTDCGFALNAGGRLSAIGDILTIKAGFSVVFIDDSNGIKAIAEAKTDKKFVFTGDTKWVPFVAAPSTIAFNEEEIASPIGVAAQLTWSIGPNGTYGTPLFTSSSEAIATVTSAGIVVGVAEGETTITATLTEGITATIKITVLPAKELLGIEFVNYFKQMVPKGGTYALKFDTVRYKFKDDFYGVGTKLTSTAFTYTQPDTSTVGDKTVNISVVYNEVTYTVPVTINVYEYFDQKIKDVQIVEWFDFSIFLFFSDTSSNHAHMTEASLTPGMLDYMSYQRADGTEVSISGYYMLAGGLVPVFVFEDLTIDNFDEHYLAGDILTIEKGMPVYKWNGEYWSDEEDNQHRGNGESVVDGYLKETVQFYFDGNAWLLYIEYTDLTVAKENVSLRIGSNVLTGVTRVPNDATMGSFTYSSSNPAVATARNGIISGISAGTAVITVTIDGGKAGKIVKTVNVTVTDYATGLEITPSTINADKGGSIDLSKLTAKFVMASGAGGAAVELEGAEITGFDAQKTGVQTVIITVTIEGIEYSGSITVNVDDGGCGGCQGAASLAGAVALLGVAFMLYTKKRSA